MAVRFCPIASGSNGNSVYIGTEDTHILIDAGLSGKRIENGLKSIDISGNMLDAIFITHEHTDHIQGVGVLSRRFDIPVYATEKTWRQMERHNMIGAIAQKNKNIVYIQENCLINDIIVNPFPIPHDSAGPVGYCVFTQERKISVATDIGHVTDCIRESIADSDALLLESNHDVEMLTNGSYPPALKRRVLGQDGHLSNVCAGQLLVEIMSQRLKNVFLGHLSEENNRPLIAFDTVCRILEAHKIAVGEDLRLLLANRGYVSEILEL